MIQAIIRPKRETKRTVQIRQAIKRALRRGGFLNVPTIVTKVGKDLGQGEDEPTCSLTSGVLRVLKLMKQEGTVTNIMTNPSGAKWETRMWRIRKPDEPATPMDRLYPSPFKVGDRFVYNNQHGSCELEAVTASMPVNTIWVKNAPAECIITMDICEQIGLITDQVRLQAAIESLDRVAFIRHDTTRTAGFVKVVALHYTNPKPAKDVIAADMAAGRNGACMG